MGGSALRTLRNARRSLAASFGAVMFFGGAAACLAGVALPHSPQADTAGYLWMAAVLVVLGLVTLFVPARWEQHTPAVTIVVGIVACAFAVHLNGESRGGPPTLNEAHYIWPVLYLGYFVTARWTVAALSLCAGSYVWALSTIGMPVDALVSRVIVLMSVLCAVAMVLNKLRRHVDRLVSRLDALARTDALTGLANRRAFDENLQRELERSARTGTPFALLLADLDRFKELNDDHGHAAGDAALVAVGDILRRLSRNVDTVARVGGEEFAILLPETELAGAIGAAERLRRAVARSRPAFRAITLSIGAVEGPRHGDTPEDLLRAADRALYAAKASGRDRTVAPDGATALAA